MLDVHGPVPSYCAAMKRFILLGITVSLANFVGAVPPPQKLVPQIEIVPQPGIPNIRPIPARPPGLVPPPPRTTTSVTKSPIAGEHVRLIDGTVFPGKFVTYDTEKGLVWRHPFITPDMQIKAPSVAKLTFAKGKLPQQAKPHTASIQLTNGDRLEGELKSLADGKLTLDTWYAGPLIINQKGIRTLSPGFEAAKTIFEGPINPKNWTFANGANPGIILNRGPVPPQLQQRLQQQRAQQANQPNWQFDGDGFEVNKARSAMVGRTFKELPDRASIEFEVDWTTYLNLYVNIYTDRLNSYSSCNGYRLQLNQSYAYLYWCSTTRGSGRVGNNYRINLGSSATGQKRSVKIALKVDKKKKLFALYTDGKYRTQWKDTLNKDFTGKGGGILFTSYSTYQMRVDNIRIREWNGTLPGQNRATAGNGKEDFVLFNNEDNITGKLLGINEGNMVFQSALYKDGLKIPLQTVETIHLSKENALPFTVPASSARVTLKGKGQMTMKILDWKDGKITAQSPIFGKATIDEAIVQSIEFNLGKARTNALVPVPPRNTTVRPNNERVVIKRLRELGRGLPLQKGAVPPEAPEVIIEQLREAIQEKRPRR